MQLERAKNRPRLNICREIWSSLLVDGPTETAAGEQRRSCVVRSMAHVCISPALEIVFFSLECGKMPAI